MLKALLKLKFSLKLFFEFRYLVALLFIVTACSTVNAKDAELKLRDLNLTNENFLSNQRKAVDELTRLQLGAHIRGDLSDLHNLQRLIDKEVIARDDTPRLQALGVVLGDVYLSENDNLQWQVLEDELGSSHVVCIKNTQYCLFPITMLSRRIEVGLNPNVEEIYRKGLNSIKDYLPKLPFSGDK